MLASSLLGSGIFSYHAFSLESLACLFEEDHVFAIQEFRRQKSNSKAELSVKYLFLWVIQGERQGNLKGPSVPILIEFPCSSPLLDNVGVFRWGGTRKDSLLNTPDLLHILWTISSSLLCETGRKIILLICCFIYLHSVMIYFDVSF